MKVKDLASALETLGKAYHNVRKKDEPAPCILQVLKFLEGKEELDINDLVTQASEKKASPSKPNKPRAFSVEENLEALKKARSEGEFFNAIGSVKKAKPTVSDL